MKTQQNMKEVIRMRNHSKALCFLICILMSLPLTVLQEKTLPLECAAVISRSLVAEGDTLSAAWKTEGGKGRYTVKECGWIILDAQGGSQYLAAGTEAAGSCTLIVPKGEKGSFVLTIEDESRQVVSTKKDFSILSLSSNPINSPSNVTTVNQQASSSPFGKKTPLPAVLNQRMATRSGPNTKYSEEMGTFPSDTSITVLEQVIGNDVPWGLVECSSNGRLYRVYTGMKRINTNATVPWGNDTPLEAYTLYKTPAYYGPGKEYAIRKAQVPANKSLLVYDYENGFLMCDYRFIGEDEPWIRAYLPVEAVSGQDWANAFSH